MEQFLILITYAFFGLVQGITEPIPISSSGHLVITEHFLGVHPKGMSFEVFMNFASLLAVLVIYRTDLIRLTKNGLSYTKSRNKQYRGDFMFIVYLVVGTLPAAILGLIFEDMISENLKTVSIIGFTLIITGLALWMIRNLRGRKKDQDLSIKDALIIGFAQAIALIPGISRSGATIVAAMTRGMKQETALRYSFLLYIPVSVGTMLLSFDDILYDPAFDQLLIPYLVAFIISFIASYFSLKWLMGIMERGNLKYFAIYCFIVGPIILLFL
ncbi:undecaprenyl-diphosphate phosphatase [Pseudalkalibacillus decolorationis]|uniref:undecaprenyl-diphosphate phosphatase n=1 Tax=Pseudalkalibacillus decolorationis TaxID=163879 RepID=UPI00214745CA|nr:undecaprenyl-diphosphate phosphatase [Pseudalkalibacillus decolorationis]